MRENLFHDLIHLAEGLYDPGLAKYGMVPDELLRDRIYQPYLQQLGQGGPAPANPPDIVPPRRVDDPRSGLVLGQLLLQTCLVRHEQAVAERTLETLRRESALAIADRRALEASTVCGGHRHPTVAKSIGWWSLNTTPACCPKSSGWLPWACRSRCFPAPQGWKTAGNSLVSKGDQV